MHRTQQSLTGKKIADVSPVNVESAFTMSARHTWTDAWEALELEINLIRRTGSFMSGQEIKLVLDGKVGQANPVDTGIPHGSLPEVPELFIADLSDISDVVERAVPGTKALSFVDDIARWAEGMGGQAVAN